MRKAICWLLLGWGTALLVAPDRVAATVLGGAPVPPAPVLRVLGARSAVQQAALLLRPSRSLGIAGAVVDALHALSMIAAAAVWPAYRRAALTSAAVAVGSAAVSMGIAGPAARDDLWGPA